MVDYNGLENRRAERHRGFESLSLRYYFQIKSRRTELVINASSVLFYAMSLLNDVCLHYIGAVEIQG